MIELETQKLIYHPDRVEEYLRTGDCNPIYVEIGLTNKCNHRCVYCALDWLGYKNTSLKFEVLKKNLKEMKKMGVKSVCYAGEGEPLLHKDFSKIIKYTKELGLDVAFSTNGLLYNEKIAMETLPFLSWIRFSLDSARPQTHAKIHNTTIKDFDIIVNNIKKAIEIKKKNKYPVTLGIQFLMIKENRDEVFDCVKLGYVLGVDNVQVKPYASHPSSLNNHTITYDDFIKWKYSAECLKDDNFDVVFREISKLRIDNKIVNYNECYGLSFMSLIDSKGNVIPCNLYYGNSEFSYGNINKTLFSKIWKSKRRKDIIKKLNSKGIANCRHGCRLDKINCYLNELKTLKTQNGRKKKT